MLTGDSFFHLAGYGEALPGLNLCGAGRVVCLIDPVGDVYACPFAIHDSFLAGNVRDPGGFAHVWQHSELFAELRQPQTGGACQSCSAYDACRGGCMAAKFFTGLPLDGPDPECVKGHGERALATGAAPHRGRPATTRTGPPPAARYRLRSAAGHRSPRATATRWPGSPRRDAEAGVRLADLTSPDAGRQRRGRRGARGAARVHRAARPAPAAVYRHRHRGGAVPPARRPPAATC